MTAILISIGIGLKNRNLAERAIFLPGLFCSLLFLIGFTIRQALTIIQWQSFQILL